MLTTYVKDITDNQFEDKVIKEEGLVLVDFWAPWCNPCKILLPILEDLANSYIGIVKFFKINIDNNKEYTSKFNIKGVPTLILFKNGENLEIKVGLISKSEINAMINNHI